MKQRIAQGFFYVLVFTMCAVVVRLLLYVLGYGLGSIALICLALGGLLLALLADINPADDTIDDDQR